MTARLLENIPAAPEAECAQGLMTALEQSISARVGEERFQLWFRGHTRFRLTDNVLLVGVPNLHYQEWLSKKFAEAVRAAALETLGQAVYIRFRIDPELFQAHRAAQEEAKLRVPAEAAVIPSAELPPVPEATSPAAPPAAPRPSRAKNGRPPTPSLFDGVDLSKSEARQQRAQRRRWRHLGSFVTGACNRVAFAAATNVVEDLGHGPNPLVLHGPVGTGKTHLLEGIFAGIKRRDPNLRVLYIAAEDFTNRFVAAMRFGKQSAFRRHFRSCDVLLLDDLHFLAKKRATQEEFLHTCNALFDEGRQVVVSCDCHPRLNEDFLPELLDRLLGGAIWGLQPPDADTRLALLQAKANGRDRETRGQVDKGRGSIIPDEVLRFLAEHLRGNVRELEGALHTLRHYSYVLSKPIDVPMAREALGELLRHAVRVLRLEDVEAAATAVLRLASGTLQSSERSWSVSHPRMLAVYLSRKHTAASYAEIAKHFGGKTHSNAVAAEKKVRDLIARDERIVAGGRDWPIRDLLDRIERELMK